MKTVLRNPIRRALLSSASKRYNSTKTADGLLKTPFYELHLELGGTMVPYAGYSMPVLYKGQTHIESHNWVREQAGLFDVSHMLQHKISGSGATEFLERVTPSDLKSLAPFTSTLSVLLNKEGGVVDDTIITKHGEDEFYVVTNAGCREKDLKFLEQEMQEFGKSTVNRVSIDGGLLALQGPKAAEVLQKLANDFDLKQLKFGSSAFVPILGDKLHVARGGYTGEDGFEVSIPNNEKGMELARLLLEDTQGIVKPIGLAARDSLRLEAGMCLYGHELSEQITPVEAGLTWVIGKSRRGKDAGFNGADKILAQVGDKSLVKNVRRGVSVKGPAARENMDVYTADSKDIKTGTKIGIVTSGSFSPTVKKNIGMVYVPRSHMKVGTEVKVNVRGKLRDGKIEKMPFVEPNYYR